MLGGLDLPAKNALHSPSCTNKQSRFTWAYNQTACTYIKYMCWQLSMRHTLIMVVADNKKARDDCDHWHKVNGTSTK